jgi:hypothetical protein
VHELDAQTDVLVAELKAFATSAHSAGIRMVWVLDGGFNPDKDETHLQRAVERELPKWRMLEELFDMACEGDDSERWSTTISASETGSNSYKTFLDVYHRRLLPKLSQARTNRDGTAKYECIRNPMFGSAEESLIMELVATGVLYNYDATVLEADAYMAQLATAGVWRGEAVGAVLAQDTDFLVFNCPYIPLYSMTYDSRGITSCKVAVKNALGTYLLEQGITCICHKIQQAGCEEYICNRLKVLLTGAIPLAPFIASLPDLSLIAGNDYYSGDDINPSIPLSFRPFHTALSCLCPDIRPHVYMRAWLSLVRTGGHFARTAGSAPAPRYIDFRETSAFLVLCVLGGLTRPVGKGGGVNVNVPELNSMMFKHAAGSITSATRASKTTTSSSSIVVINGHASTYLRARESYSLVSEFATNATPPYVQSSGYLDLRRRLLSS